MTNEVKISKSKADRGKDEWWCTWYNCPECKDTSIAGSFKYCPVCGVHLIWED
jgi:ssDNA-binding Zn-finger/Zn-ribbon topoisomerase 1